MKHATSKFSIIALAAVILASSFSLGFMLGNEQRSSEPPTYLIGNEGQPDTVDMSLFWQAWSTLEERYVDAASTTPEERLWGSIKGLASSYGDQYTTFLPPEDTKTFNETISGNFGGVGMEIGLRNELLTVIAPLKGTPADRAGIRAGDHIIAIDNAQTADVSLERAVQLIRGPIGESVSLTVFRPSTEESMVVDIVRDSIQIPTIDTTLRNDGVFVISLYNFSALSPQLFQNALREFAESGSVDLLIDLRGNPGGFLSAAVDITSWFLPAGKVIVRENFGDKKEEEVRRSKGYDVFTDVVDIAVLVDGGSASASEIVAGALRDHSRATIVGTQTFGKGSVQELIPLSNSSTLKITIAKWLTPKGTSISDGGLKPDIVVEITMEDIEAGRDPQLEKAAEILIEK